MWYKPIIQLCLPHIVITETKVVYHAWKQTVWDVVRHWLYSNEPLTTSSYTTAAVSISEYSVKCLGNKILLKISVIKCICNYNV